jgi:hypothetical protein
MSVIYYSSNDNEPALRFKKIIMTESKEEKIERYKSIEELSNRLRQSNLENNIAILFISDIAEIYQICLMKNLLNDIRIILILPDRSAEMISAAFKLYPRFISYIDSDFKDEIVVLKRMIKQVATN